MPHIPRHRRRGRAGEQFNRQRFQALFDTNQPLAPDTGGVANVPVGGSARRGTGRRILDALEDIPNVFDPQSEDFFEAALGTGLQTFAAFNVTGAEQEAIEEQQADRDRQVRGEEADIQATQARAFRNVAATLPEAPEASLDPQLAAELLRNTGEVNLAAAVEGGLDPQASQVLNALRQEDEDEEEEVDRAGIVRELRNRGENSLAAAVEAGADPTSSTILNALRTRTETVSDERDKALGRTRSRVQGANRFAASQVTREQTNMSPSALRLRMSVDQPEEVQARMAELRRLSSPTFERDSTIVAQADSTELARFFPEGGLEVDSMDVVDAGVSILESTAPPPRGRNETPDPRRAPAGDRPGAASSARSTRPPEQRAIPNLRQPSQGEQTSRRLAQELAARASTPLPEGSDPQEMEEHVRTANLLRGQNTPASEVVAIFTDPLVAEGGEAFTVAELRFILIRAGFEPDSVSTALGDGRQ